MSFTTRRLLTDSTGSQYRIPNSLRFRSSASAYLSRTPSVAGNRKTFTWSGWVKRGALGVRQTLFSAEVSASRFAIFLDYVSGAIDIHGNGTIWRTSASLFRDPSAWYHIVVSVNTDDATAQNRIRVYVNSSEITQWSANSTVGSGTQFTVNNLVAHAVGRDTETSSYYFDGYLTEVNFIDGQALDPLAFGRIDSKTGVWTPSKYTGTYGTNGFYLKFTDTSSNTATGIGKDFSGNGNNWTPNNISLTAGATYDSMIDTPTPYDDGGYGRGNYCNLSNIAGFTSTITDAGMNYSTNTLAAGTAISNTALPKSGKFYAEFHFLDNPTAPELIVLGIVNQRASIGAGGNFPGQDTNGYGLNSLIGQTVYNGIYSAYTSAFSINDVIGIAVDVDSGTLTYYKNGVSLGIAYSSIPFSSFDWFFALSDYTTSSYGSNVAVNFGQRPFAYTPPTGFKTLCTQNLPTPAIVNPALYMAATTYAGTGATQTIANTVNNKSFQPDLVWIKGRSAATDHALYDSVRGATKDLVSNSAAAETTQASGLTTFGSNGFTVGNLGKLNTNAQTYVAWQWKAGDSTVTNTAGTITSQVDANPTAGFSIVSYTGTGASNPTIGHGLGATPAMIICKNRDTATSAANDWFVYHKDVGAGYLMLLNNTNARATISGTTQGSIGTSPSTSTFTIAAGSIGSLNLNESGDRHVAYCFAEVEGFSKFGSYTGNGSADGPFLYCGFRPKWLMVKRTDSTAGPWFIMDSSRSTYNQIMDGLPADQNVVENTIGGYDRVDFLSNGVKKRDTSLNTNASGGTYIFAAFAEAPFKYALAR